MRGLGWTARPFSRRARDRDDGVESGRPGEDGEGEGDAAGGGNEITFLNIEQIVYTDIS